MEPVEVIHVSVSTNRMKAYIEIKDVEEVITEEMIHKCLKVNRIVHGIKEESIKLALHQKGRGEILVAAGTSPENGADGRVIFDKKISFDLQDHEKTSFRDVLSIPSVEEGERIGVVISPGLGTDGVNVYGEPVPSKEGKPTKYRPGKNIEFKRADSSYYASMAGQLSVEQNRIHVHPLYVVQGDIDLKTGNLKFVGSIHINGNVPSGYHIQAEGDVTITGMVESAEVTAGGSIFITNGVSGSGKAVLKAGADIRSKYINRAHVEAGRDLFVENSILHSQCIASRNIECHQGHIIGGTVSAGSMICAKDIGNHLHTKTGLYLGTNKLLEDQKKLLENKLEKHLQEQQKLLFNIGKLSGIKEQPIKTRDRILLLRYRSILEEKETEILHVQEQVDAIGTEMGQVETARVEVKGKLFAYVHIGFGKYQYPVRKDYTNVLAYLDHGEIVLKSLNQ